MKTKTIFKTALTAVAFAVAGAVSTSASAALVFQIQEGAITGAIPNAVPLSVDRISGEYKERVFFTSPNTFTATAYFNAGGYFLNSAPVPSQLNQPDQTIPLPFPPFTFTTTNGYGMYAVFRSDGTISTSGGTTTFTGDPSGTNQLQIFSDPNQDTTKSLGAGGVVIGGGTGDDQLLAVSNALLFGLGEQNNAVVSSGNSFELVFDNFQLQPAGDAFFVAPRPFYIRLDLSGNFRNFTPGATGTFVDTEGSASASFVPEPTTLALLGASLLGLGFSTRRKKLS